MNSLLHWIALAVVAALHGALIVQPFGPLADLPAYLENKALSSLTISLVLVFVAGQLLALPIWGALLDRIGPKSVLTASAVMACVGAIAAFTIYARIPLPRRLIVQSVWGLSATGGVLAMAFAASLTAPSERGHLPTRLLAPFFAGGALMMSAAWVWTRLDLLPRQFFVASSTVILLVGILAVVLSRLLVPDVRPKSESYRGINALHNPWQGFGVVMGLPRGLAVCLLLGLTGAALAWATLWWPTSWLRAQSNWSAGSVKSLLLYAGPWLSVTLGATLAALIPVAGSARLVVGGVAVLAVAASFGLILTLPLGYGITLAASCLVAGLAGLLALLAFSALLAPARSKSVGALLGAAFFWWMAGFGGAAAAAVASLSTATR